MVDVSFENLYPIAGLIIISVSIWGAAKKFTAMDVTIMNNQKDNERNFSTNHNDIKRLKEEVDDMKKDIREIYTLILKLQQKVEDKFTETK